MLCPLYPLPSRTQITLLQQQVVLQELPTARVTLPGAGSKSLEPSATAAAALLARQSRVAVHVPQGRLEAVTPFLNMLLTPPGSPAQPKLPEQQKQQQHQQQQEGRSEGSTPPQPRQRSARDNKRRECLALLPAAGHMQTHTHICTHTHMYTHA